MNSVVVRSALHCDSASWYKPSYLVALQLKCSYSDIGELSIRLRVHVHESN